MKPRLLWLLAMVLCVHVWAYAQATYSATFSNATPASAIRILKKATGYDFVYEKVLITNNSATVTGSYRNTSLSELLDATVGQQLGLSYKILGTTVSLSESKKSSHPFSARVTGTVVDEAGEPLAGATILLKDTHLGVSADIDGRFNIQIHHADPVLEVSYMGMYPATVHLNTANISKPLKITLKTNASTIDEIVVTGYQTLKRENATGAYQSITGKELEQRYTGTITANLEGKIPGLVSYNNGFKSGEDALTIRGASSIQAVTKPLIVVDGLPIEGSLETVNPYDISNITVLKDAAAAAIYGARASNGVIVISTKKADSDRVVVDVNADLTITEKNNYDNMGWASAAEFVELEKYNFDWMAAIPNSPYLSIMSSYYNSPDRRFSMQPIVRDLYANYVGDLSDGDLKKHLDRYAAADYRSEWQDAFERTRVLQQYNVSMRHRGQRLASSIVLNYRHDNMGMADDRETSLMFKYSGQWEATKWLNINFGTTVINNREKTNVLRPGINDYTPIHSLYNPDGSLADLTLGFDENVPAMQNPSYGLKSMWYNPLAETDMGLRRSRDTNMRTYVQGIFKLLPRWTVSGHFQYEDIYFKSETYKEAESYSMRSIYNRYTMLDPATNGVKHNVPDGGRLDTSTSEGNYWTFRGQTQYANVLFGKLDVDAIAGFEFRESRTRSYSNVLMGYDDQTQNNQNENINWYDLSRLLGKASVMGPDYRAGSLGGGNATSGDILHRFYSIYATGNFVYDSKYALSGSWRIDKTDLFGTDPKFRGRPLWSVGASWNMHNENFMKDITWIKVLKPRISYGLTGNIDSSVSSYLTGSIGINSVNSLPNAYLNTPPNDKLRWEKTATWNFGTDFALFDYRLRGSFDYYHKKGSDLLVMTDTDPQTGWNSLTINNGNMTNHGFEIQLNGEILRPTSRNSLGINLGVNFSHNKNEVTYVNHEPSSGYEALQPYTLHKGYPVHSLYSFKFAGLKEEGQMQYITWYDHNGEINNSRITSTAFTPEDIVYSGSLDPKVSVAMTPEITYAGFSLSAMLNYYGGHVMRVNTQDMSADGSYEGYDVAQTVGFIPSSYLNYWITGDHEKYMANGAPGMNVQGGAQARYMHTNVVPADYLKLRNIVLGYTLPKQFSRQLGIEQARVRVQFNNIATWVRNNEGKDPEAVNPITGSNLTKTPRSYTFSLLLNF